MKNNPEHEAAYKILHALAVVTPAGSTLHCCNCQALRAVDKVWMCGHDWRSVTSADMLPLIEGGIAGNLRLKDAQWGDPDCRLFVNVLRGAYQYALALRKSGL